MLIRSGKGISIFMTVSKNLLLVSENEPQEFNMSLLAFKMNGARMRERAKSWEEVPVNSLQGSPKVEGNWNLQTTGTSSDLEKANGWHLNFSSVRPWTENLEKPAMLDRERMNVCYYKPLNCGNLLGNNRKLKERQYKAMITKTVW